MSEPEARVRELIESISEHAAAIREERRRHGVKGGDSLLAHLDNCDCAEVEHHD